VAQISPWSPALIGGFFLAWRAYRSALWIGNCETVRSIFRDLVSQRPDGDAEQARRNGPVAVGCREGFKHKIALNVLDVRSDKTPSQATTRWAGNR
jgi:hypothetical protein